QRSQVDIEVLGEFARSVGDQVEVEFCLSSSNGRSDREDHPVLGRFSEGLWFGARREFGYLFVID
ncbi:hypothetical protein A2U01_0071286, partial [Trifolium medium]|nr:hypothetical protein [Trifolium medium]